MILLSGWIFFKKGKAKAEIEVLISERRAAYCGLIATELLRGARGEKELDILSNLFDVLICVKESYETFCRAGKLGYSLARKGINLATIDLVIAQVCLDNELIIFSYDEHFATLAKYGPLKMFEAFHA